MKKASHHSSLIVGAARLLVVKVNAEARPVIAGSQGIRTTGALAARGAGAKC